MFLTKLARFCVSRQLIDNRFIYEVEGPVQTCLRKRGITLVVYSSELGFSLIPITLQPCLRFITPPFHHYPCIHSSKCPISVKNFPEIQLEHNNRGGKFSEGWKKYFGCFQRVWRGKDCMHVYGRVLDVPTLQSQGECGLWGYKSSLLLPYCKGGVQLHPNSSHLLYSRKGALLNLVLWSRGDCRIQGLTQHTTTTSTVEGKLNYIPLSRVEKWVGCKIVPHRSFSSLE